MPERFARCRNRDYCSLGDRGLLLRLAEGEPFYCPECGRALVPAGPSRSASGVMWLKAVASAMAGAAVAAGATFLPHGVAPTSRTIFAVPVLHPVPVNATSPPPAVPAIHLGDMRVTQKIEVTILAVAPPPAALLPPPVIDDPAPAVVLPISQANVAALAATRPAVLALAPPPAASLPPPMVMAPTPAIVVPISQTAVAVPPLTRWAILAVTPLPATLPPPVRTAAIEAMVPAILRAPAHKPSVPTGKPPAPAVATGRHGAAPVASAAAARTHAARVAAREAPLAMRPAPAPRQAAKAAPLPPADTAQSAPGAVAASAPPPHTDDDAAAAPAADAPTPKSRVFVLPTDVRMSYGPLKDVNLTDQQDHSIFMTARPSAARPQRGNMKLDCAIGTNGMPSDCRVLSADKAGSVSKALLALLGSGMVRRAPKMENGHPVASRQTVTLEFDAQAGPRPMSP
jgi:hypothetical protein